MVSVVSIILEVSCSAFPVFSGNFILVRSLMRMKRDHEIFHLKCIDFREKKTFIRLKGSDTGIEFCTVYKGFLCIIQTLICLPGECRLMPGLWCCYFYGSFLASVFCKHIPLLLSDCLNKELMANS